MRRSLAKFKKKKKPEPFISATEKKCLLVLSAIVALVLIGVITISFASPGTRLWEFGRNAGIIVDRSTDYTADDDAYTPEYDTGYDLNADVDPETGYGENMPLPLVSDEIALDDNQTLMGDDAAESITALPADDLINGEDGAPAADDTTDAEDVAGIGY